MSGDTLIRVSHEHQRACERAARLLRELDGIGDGMLLDGVGAMLIADDLDEIADRIRKAYAVEQDSRLPQWKRRKFRAGGASLTDSPFPQPPLETVEKGLGRDREIPGRPAGRETA